MYVHFTGYAAYIHDIYSSVHTSMAEFEREVTHVR